MQNDGLETRSFLETDIPAAAVIEQEAFEENAWGESALASELRREDSVMFSVLSGGELAGYVSMRTVLDEGYIGDIAVAPRFRRLGVGSALVEELIHVGKRRGLRFITLEARVSNDPAIALYESMGFRDAGVRRGFYSFPREDARLMTLYLK